MGYSVIRFPIGRNAVNITNQKQSKKGRYEPMNRNILRNLGTINVEEIAIMGGQIEVFVSVDVISDELDAVIVRCEEHYRARYAEVVNVAVNVNLVFTMGYANPEFALQIVLFDKNNEDNYEEYDDFFVGDIELSTEQKKQIKKVMWNKLGEYLLDI